MQIKNIRTLRGVVIFGLSILMIACNQKKHETSNINDLKKEERVLENKTEAPKTEADIILDIKEKYASIHNNLKSFKVVTKEAMGESTEGGYLEGYYSDKALKKIVASYFGEMGKQVEAYYFWEDELFFVFTQTYQYNMPIHMEGSKVEAIEEQRYYFNKRKIVRWLNANKEKVSRSQFSQKEVDILQKIERIKKAFEDKELDDEEMTSTFRMLQGKWQHVDDKTNFVVFKGNSRSEIAGDGASKWSYDEFELSDTCLNEYNKAHEVTPEKDRYISCMDSDLCWYIVEINENRLELAYMGRGNTLSYIRVK